ncbi:hypothetical protein M408DRAFT_332078, partial [Serendipita vermifera MAFF 305830]
MEPISAVLSIIIPVISVAKATLVMIETQAQKEHSHNDALKDLRIAVDALKRDATGYEILLSSILSGVDKRPIERLCSNPEGREALRNLDVAFKAAKLLMEQNQVNAVSGSAGLYGTQAQPAAKRPPIRELVFSFLKANFKPDDGTEWSIRDTAKDLDVCRSNCESAFKMTWHLYVIYQQAPSRRSTVDNRNHKGELGPALDNVLSAFNHKPFSVSPEGDNRVRYSKLTVLNQSHEYAKAHEELMRRAGKAWVDERADLQMTNFQTGKTISRIQALGQLQTSLFEVLWTSTVEQLKRHGSNWAEGTGRGSANPEAVGFKNDLLDLEKGLQEAILRAKKQRFAIAFCGMVKAGKSLFLNALIGEPILPSDELPSTAWPCRLRHVPNQAIPQLEFDDAPFISGIAALKEARYGARLSEYQPPSDDVYDVMFEEETEEPSPEEVRMKELHAQWVDLHAATKENLKLFEQPNYYLPSKATGHREVKDLLSKLNDVVRLCHRFKLNFNMEDVEWPLLTVEFNSLRGHQMDGIYEFIDLPGIGEQFESFDFESMIRLVAKDSNAIVPILSFKELSRSDWKKLPEIVAHGFGNRTSIVVCTHLDQIGGRNLTEQLATVSKVFWPRNIPGTTTGIIPCSSLMGLSARALLDQSKRSKPPFKSIWDKNKKQVEYPCAEKILGTGQPEETYNRMSPETWRAKLEINLSESGLPDAINKLTREMVDQAKQRAFLSESIAVCKQLKKMSAAQERKLLEARRSKNEFDEAKREYDAARAKFFQLIDSWNVAEHQQKTNYHNRMKKGLTALKNRTDKHIADAISQTLRNWTLGSAPSIEEHTPDQRAGHARDEGRNVSVLVVKSVHHAEEFLRLSQKELQGSLNREKQDFVTAVRKMAEEARAKRFQELKDEFARLDPQIQPELREEIIEDLNNQSVDIRQVIFNHIKNEIKTTKTRHTAATAFRAIEEKLAKPLLSQNEDPIQVLDEGEQKALKTVDDLGFMLRAPISAMATIPFVFGLPIWPWMAYSKSFHLEMNIIESQYRREIVEPWYRILQEESQKALSGTIVASSEVAREAVLKALSREDGRYERESAHKNSPTKAGMVQHMVAMQSNLYAAEAALTEIQYLLKESINDSQS